MDRRPRSNVERGKGSWVFAVLLSGYKTMITSSHPMIVKSVSLMSSRINPIQHYSLSRIRSD